MAYKSLFVVDLIGYGETVAGDCVPEFFASRADAEAYVAAASRIGWDWDWVERGEVRECLEEDETPTRAVITEDGYLLLEIGADRWSDGDLMFESIDCFADGGTDPQGYLLIDDVDALGCDAERLQRIRNAIGEM